jgi:hypothetical protein
VLDPHVEAARARNENRYVRTVFDDFAEVNPGFGDVLKIVKD